MSTPCLRRDAPGATAAGECAGVVLLDEPSPTGRGTRAAQACIVDRHGRTLGRADLSPMEFPADAIRVGLDSALAAAGVTGGAGALRGLTIVGAAFAATRGGRIEDRITSPSWAPTTVDAIGESAGHRPTLLDPARAAAIGEQWRGAGRGRRNSLVVTLDQMLDGALFVQGRLLGGPSGNAGSPAHICVDPYGPRCVCGARGCLAAIASGDAILDWVHRHGGGRRSLGALVSAVYRGDPIAVATIRRAGEAIGQVAAGLVTTLDLDVVIVSGELLAAGPALLNAIADGHARAARLPFAGPDRIVGATLGNAAVEAGAAAVALVPDLYGER